jgi:hypothetical protein
MIWDQEPLLPPHKDHTAVSIVKGQVRALCVVSDVLEGRKSRPVHQVLVLGRTPILSEEPITAANDLGVKIRREFWPVIRETSDPEIATEG